MREEAVVGVSARRRAMADVGRWRLWVSVNLWNEIERVTEPSWLLADDDRSQADCQLPQRNHTCDCYYYYYCCYRFPATIQDNLRLWVSSAQRAACSSPVGRRRRGTDCCVDSSRAASWDGRRWTATWRAAAGVESDTGARRPRGPRRRRSWTGTAPPIVNCCCPCLRRRCRRRRCAPSRWRCRARRRNTCPPRRRRRPRQDLEEHYGCRRFSDVKWYRTFKAEISTETKSSTPRSCHKDEDRCLQTGRDRNCGLQVVKIKFLISRQGPNVCSRDWDWGWDQILKTSTEIEIKMLVSRPVWSRDCNSSATDDVSQSVVVVPGLGASTPAPLADVARRLLALVEDGGEDEHVEEEQAAADRDRDPERNRAVATAVEQWPQQARGRAPRRGRGRTRGGRRRTGSRRQRRRRRTATGDGVAGGAWRDRRGGRVHPGRRGGRRGIRSSQLVQPRQVDAGRVETVQVVEVVEKVKALVEIVWTVDLRDEVEPQSHLGASQMVSDHRPTVCYHRYTCQVTIHAPYKLKFSIQYGVRAKKRDVLSCINSNIGW